MPFLPVTNEELGGNTPDVVLVSADAYVDHPSFGHAIISRLIESLGFSVAMLPQPVSDADFCRFGEPRIGFFISGGVVDSMVNNYTAALRKRSDDVYSEGGAAGKRPDRCVQVYTRTLKRLFPAVPVVIGGIEASLRRFAHYDYWSDSVMPSILVDSGADLLIYGMGERPIIDLFSLVSKNVPLKNIRDVAGTSYLSSYQDLSKKLQEAAASGSAVFCPPFETVKKDPKSYAKAFQIQSKYSDHALGKPVLQKHGNLYVVQNPPQRPMRPEELDAVYALPYMRREHPMYRAGVPALDEVKYSLTSVRGCYGSCNYCALTYHQGRVVQKRSLQNIVQEAEAFTKDTEFKGYIHDIGGPTANFRDPACSKQMTHGVCADKSCIGYEKCPNLEVSHTDYLKVLKALREIDGVKKVFIRSGIRFDYVLYDEDEQFMRELVKHHISGQLKVAPEHCSEGVLKAMNKPSFRVYLDFKKRFDEMNARLGKKQYLVPYLISSHPGSTLADAVALAEYLHSISYMPEQVQDFYPTPSTKSTCMYYTGLDPDTMEEIYVPKTKEEKQMQRALLQYRKKENYEIVKRALVLAGRQDLIGFSKNCLIRPTKEEAIKAKKAPVRAAGQNKKHKNMHKNRKYT